MELCVYGVFMHFTLCLCCVYEKCLYCIWRLVSFCVYGVFLYFTQCLYSVNDSMRSGFGQVLVCISVCLLGIKLEYMCFPFYYGDVPINTVIITVFVLRVVFMVVFMKLCLWCVYDKKRLTPCLCVRFLLSFRFHISDSIVQVSDFRFQIPGFRFRVSVVIFEVLDFV